MLSSLSGAPAHLPRKGPGGDDEVNPLLCCIKACLVMKLPALFAEFEHIAQHAQVPLCGDLHQGINAAANRIRIGIVAVVDQSQPVRPYQFPSAPDIPEIGNSGGNLFIAQPQQHSDCCGSQRRMDVLYAEGRNPHRNPAQSADDVTVQFCRGLDVLRPDIAVSAEAEAYFSLPAGKCRQPFIIAVHQHRRRLRNVVQHLGFGPEDAVQILQEFQMGMPDDRIDRHGRLHHMGQMMHFAEFRDPHFDHGCLTALIQP